MTRSALFDDACLYRDRLFATARGVIKAEIETLQQIELNANFAIAVRLLEECAGQIVVTGVGKSGIVAQRIAATLTVTGTPAWYLHPADALHGDVGKVQHSDVLLIVSRGGESDEVSLLLSHVRHWLELPSILITAAPESTLARQSTCTLVYPGGEACPYNLTPTTSSTVAGVLGDALALVLQDIKGFGPEEFAAFHKQGALGRRLTCTVREVMVTGDAVGTVAPAESLLTAMVKLAHKRGTLAVCCDCKRTRVVGVITAGDVARYLESRGPGWEQELVATVMTEEAHMTTPDTLVSVVLQQMEEAGIMAMPVVEHFDVTEMQDEAPVEVGLLMGMVHLHDILRAGVQ